MADRGGLDGLTVSRVDATAIRGRGMGTYKRDSGTTPEYAPYDLTEEGVGDTPPERTVRLYEESVGYRNLANDKDVAERAKAAVLLGLKDVFNVMEFLRNKWLILYRLYRGETVNEFSFGRLPLHSPEPYKIVETMQPEIFRTIFGGEDWFRLLAEDEQHDVNSRAQQALCRKDIREMRHAQKAGRGIRGGLIFGTAIQKLWWKQEKGDLRHRVGKRRPHESIPGATTLELEEVKTTEFIYDGNWMENVEIFDFLTSPNASGIDEAEWCADRSMWMDWKVKAMGEMGHWLNLEALRDHVGSRDSSFGDEFKERKSYAYGVFDPREASSAPHIPHYEVVDWWGPLVVREESGNYVTKECNVVMIEPHGMQLIVRITENPYWHKQKPYQAWKPIDLENEFYGIGAIEMIARLSREKDVKRQLLMAATQLEANPMFEVSDQANIPDGQLILQPGLCLRVPVVGQSIAPIHVPKVSDAALKAENQLTLDIRETAGTNSPSMGAQDPFGKGKTATQHTSEVDQSKLRIAPMISNYETQIIVPMLHQMAWNNKQFMSYQQVVRDVGSSGINYTDRYTIKPEDLLGRFIVQPLASTRLLTKQTQVQQLVNLLDRIPILAQLYGPQAINGPKLFSHILEIGFDIRNHAEYVKLPPSESDHLLTAMQEQELWYHGSVPPVRADDNHMRHTLSHLEELQGDRFDYLYKHDNAIAAKARAHIAEHFHILALTQEQQEKQIMDMQQVANAMQITPPTMGGMSMDAASADMNVAGAGTPDQQPTSPKVRSNEVERGEGSGQQQQSAAMSQAPNAGAV